MIRPALTLSLFGALLVACLGGTPGYDAKDPTVIVCGCHDGQTCYDAAAEADSRLGETDESAEQLLYLSQCACFQDSIAGCNTLAHFAKDWVAECDAGKDVARSCAIAGFVHHHAVSVPPRSGRSFHRDPAAAKAAFARACSAGSRIACAQE
ncbi:hypothetical protein BH09MYX1_BH09MYX1_30090 [soil metagenome]